MSTAKRSTKTARPTKTARRQHNAKYAERSPITPFNAWIVAFPSGVSWGMPHRTRAEAIAGYVRDSSLNASGWTDAEIRAVWNDYKRDEGIACVHVLVTEDPS